jgi:hypothetical protein
MVSVVKMVTVTEECTTEDQRSVVRFLWAKGLSAKDIHKEIFSVYVGSFCRVSGSQLRPETSQTFR